MAEDLIESTGVTVVHDETAGLQNSEATPTPAGDADDDDVLVSDLPSEFSAELTAKGFDPAGAIGAAESDGNVITINGTGITDVKFTDALGAPLDGDSSGLFTTEGEEVFLFTDPDNNNIVLGKTAAGDIVFAIYLEETGDPLSGGKFWTVQYESLSNPLATNPDDPIDLTNKLYVTADQALVFNFDQLNSGANLFGAVGATTGTALVVIGEDIALGADGKYIANQTDDIKTSQGGDGATIGIDSQMFDPGEGAYFTYVTNTDVIGTGDNANSITYDDTQEVTGAAFRISQTQGNDLATAQISAYDLADAPQGVAFVNARGTGDPVSITTVRVFNAAGVLIEEETDGVGTSVDDPTVDIVFSGAPGARIATVSGLDDLYTVAWDTSDVHDQVLIKGVAGKFDIGRFALTQAATDTDEVGSKVIFEDDGPVNNAATVNVNVDEDELTGLSTGITDNDATTTVATFTGAQIAGLVNAGADEPVKVSLNPAIDNVDTGLDSQGANILFDVISPTQVNGVAGGRTVFTLVQDDGVDNVLGTADDVFTFTLLDQIDHTPLATGGGDDETIVLSLASVFVATDFDNGNTATPTGDSVVIDAGATVTIENDIPVNNAAVVNVNVDEDELTGLSTGNTDNDATTTVATFTGAQIAGLVNAGADEPVKVSLNPAIDNVDTGLDSQGANILFDVISPTQVNGVAGGRTVFTLVQDDGVDNVLGTADDVFTFTLLDQIDHTPLATGGGDDETIALSLADVFVATDFDGDSVVIDAGATVTIENDIPVNNAAVVNVNVDEDELTGLSTGNTDNDATTTVATFTGAQIAGLVNAGADEPVKVSLNPAIDNVDTGLDSQGANILFDVISPTQVNGVAGGRTVFTLVQDDGVDNVLGTADDVFTFTLLDQIDHTPLALGGGDAETIALSLADVFVATDFDGDSVVIDAGATVTIENDIPVNNAAVVNVNVDEDELTGLSTGNTDNDATTTVATFTGAQIAGLVNAGADEPVKVSLNPAIDNVDTGLDSQGANILFDVISPTQVNGVAGGRTVFTLVQDDGVDNVLGTADDVFTFTLLDQIDHTPLALGGGDAETIALSLADVFVATDFDGDSVVIDAGATVTIENDIPVNNAAVVNVNVDEDELTGLSTGNTDNDATTTVATFTGAQIAGLVNAGADEPVKVSLNPAIDNVDTGLDSQGANILFDVISPTQVNGVAGGRTVFTLVQDDGVDNVLGTADDVFTFTLLDQIDHTPLALGGGDAETIALSLADVFVATDFDGDSVVIDAGASVTIENDVPTIGPVANGRVDFTTISGANPDDFGGTSISSVTNPLNGAVGADEPATYTVTSSPASVTIFDGTSAELILQRDISGGGTVVTYYEDVDGSGTRNAGDTDFFQLTVSGGNYTFSVLQDPPPAVLEFDFDQLPSGASLFGAVGTTANALVVIGQDIGLDANGKYITNQTDDIKSSQGGVEATIGIDSQMFDPGDGAYFTYVTNTSVIGVGDNANSIQYGDTQEVTSAGFRISQTQGNEVATARITAYDLDDDPAPQGVAFVNARGTGDPVSITAVRVFNAAGVLIEEETDGVGTSVDDPTVDIVFSGAPGARIATVSGLDDLYTIVWDTSAVHDQVLIEGVAGKFDIGRFATSQPQPTPDEKLDFTVQIADFDGDTATADFSVGIDGTGVNDDDVVTGVVVT